MAVGITSITCIRRLDKFSLLRQDTRERDRLGAQARLDQIRRIAPAAAVRYAAAFHPTATWSARLVPVVHVAWTQPVLDEDQRLTVAFDAVAPKLSR